MNEKAIKTLEFHKIREMLLHHAGSSLGKERAAALMPLTQREEIERMQQQTADAYQRICTKGNLSFSGIPDIRDSFLRLERGGTLTMAELLRVGSLLTATLRAKNYGYSADRENEENEGDSLTEIFSMLVPLSPLKREIERCILSEEEMADDASSGLRSVRRRMKTIHDRIHERLGAIVSQASAAGMLQDALITMRDGRYCLPYRSEYKNQVSGMVHDQSATGSTSFIEPMEVVRLNNELRELAVSEKEEIEKVLADLSAQLAPEVDHLRFDQDSLAELDFIFARGKLAQSMMGIRPDFSEDRSIVIKQGRHPLIDARKVVPIDISLGKDYSMIVITGPNTGGKTVTLKTVGLFTLMGQAGLHIPAKQGSVLGVFREVYADIGDEQSIEQSLSTFSSHMTNTVHILQEITDEDMALFDELGAGTDPTEGAALAMAILNSIHRYDIRALATTHYAELKVFAMTTPGVVNACCEFNVETLSPTYRLLVGIPGKSNAFAISRKLGLSSHIIEEADSFIGIKDKSFEDMLTELEEKRQMLEQELAAARADKREAALIRSEWEKKQKTMDDRREQILRKANEEARNILEEAKEYADSTIKRMRRLEQSGTVGKAMEEERRKVREKLGSVEEKNGLVRKEKRKESKASDFHIGDTVHVLSMNLNGTIHTLPNEKGDCFVTMGIMQTKCNIRDLELVQEESSAPAKKTYNTGSSVGAGKSATISPEINLVGKRVDEAIAELDKYLDDAYLAHLAQVTVIHGRGTGALRTAVQNHCCRLKYVKEFHAGAYGEGDHGVTIVVFR